MVQQIIKWAISAFTRQVSRDAGKVVSNKVFGNKHAAPYRRVDKNKK